MSRINWPLYNRALVARGSIQMWFDESLAADWYADPLEHIGKRGGQYVYSDKAITALGIIRIRFGLTLRETEGFATELAVLMGMRIKIPCYTTIARRLSQLTIDIAGHAHDDIIHVVVDSTGLKVYGEGEWRVKIHGKTKIRTWRKLHLAIDESNDQILSVVLTENSFKDSEVFTDLLEPIDSNIEQVTGDGGYDAQRCYEWLGAQGINGVFPPRHDAKITQHGNHKAIVLQRDEHIRWIRKVGRKRWKKDANYHRRSLAETAMHRFKALTGDRLVSRKFENQASEVFLRCKILNRMPTPRILFLGSGV